MTTDWEWEFWTERDRRYTAIAVEKEKALKIKETADLAALQLAREIQTYKDEKANELREQISSERGNYASKDDLASTLREIKAGQREAHDSGRLDIAQMIQVIVALIMMATVIILVLHGG